jgi:hypothetical protein
LIGSAACRFFHHIINGYFYFVIPFVSFFVGSLAEARYHGWKSTIQWYALRAISASVIWGIPIFFILNISMIVAQLHQWDWNSNLTPWILSFGLLFLSSIASLAASHREWPFAALSSGSIVILYAMLAPQHFFNIPFKLLLHSSG